jgi:hypothetical protein
MKSSFPDDRSRVKVLVCGKLRRYCVSEAVDNAGHRGDGAMASDGAARTATRLQFADLVVNATKHDTKASNAGLKNQPPIEHKDAHAKAHRRYSA